jgi:hypothetical protein
MAFKNEKKPLSAKKKVIIGVSSALILCVAALCFWYFFPFPGKPNDYVFSLDDVYDIEDTVILQKNPEKDFVILNLADLQVYELDLFSIRQTKNLIADLIAESKPDLITLTGDQGWMQAQKIAVIDILSYVDSFGIPWAAVLGNHDIEDVGFTMNALGDLYESFENSVFKKGPNNLSDVPSVGNYIINIMEGEEIVQTLYMLDSHSLRTYPDGKISYDYIHPKQIEWYSWGVNGASEYNISKGKAPAESLLFFHIPLREYIDAYAYWESTGFDPAVGSGVMMEDPCPAPVNTGFFEVIKTLGNTKSIIVGHDHINNFIINYQGVRLVYAQKSSDKCYAPDDLGGTVISISRDKVDINHKIIPLR